MSTKWVNKKNCFAEVSSKDKNADVKLKEAIYLGKKL